MNEKPYIEPPVVKRVDVPPTFNIFVAPLLLSEINVAKLLCCNVRKVKKLTQVGVFTARKNDQRLIYYRNEIEQTLQKIFCKEFPDNFNDLEQREVLIECFMSTEERNQYLANKMFKAKRGKK